MPCRSKMQHISNRVAHAPKYRIGLLFRMGFSCTAQRPATASAPRVYRTTHRSASRFTSTTRWIHEHDRIVLTIRIPVNPICVSDGIGLQESADVEGVVSGAVVVQGGLVVGAAGGEHVRIADGARGDFGVIGVVDRRCAEDIVGVALGYHIIDI